MKNPIDQLTEGARDIRLESGARSRIRADLVRHMRAHPAQALSPYTRFLNIVSPLSRSALRLPALALVAVLLIAGATTTYAAEGSLPGDTLYPFKVGVIEPAQGLLAVTPAAKAAWNVTLAQTRLNEAAQLSAKAPLTPAKNAQLAHNFNHALVTAQASIEVLARDNPAAASSTEKSLSSSLAARASVLSLLGFATSSEAVASSTSMHRGLLVPALRPSSAGEKKARFMLSATSTSLRIASTTPGATVTATSTITATTSVSVGASATASVTAPAASAASSVGGAVHSVTSGLGL